MRSPWLLEVVPLLVCRVQKEASEESQVVPNVYSMYINTDSDKIRPMIKYTSYTISTHYLIIRSIQIVL